MAPLFSMYQRIQTLSSLSPEMTQTVRHGVEVLQTGGMVAYPTDTLYGLGCDPWNVEAVRRLFRAKGRPLTQAVPLLLAEIESLSNVAAEVSNVVFDLARCFWPGALTLVVLKAPGLPLEVTAGGDTVAVRLPNHPVPRGLATGVGGTIVGTSANRSGDSDPVTAQQARGQLGDAVDLVIDGGRCQAGRGSTILDVAGPVWRIIREGPVTQQQLAEAGFASHLER